MSYGPPTRRSMGARTGRKGDTICMGGGAYYRAQVRESRERREGGGGALVCLKGRGERERSCSAFSPVISGAYMH